jgi:D-hexose-6-phosphate mutarotase
LNAARKKPVSESIANLNTRFALENQLHFTEGPGGLTVADIAGQFGRTMISLSGGHVMTWSPVGHEPVLWLSPHAKFSPGKSIRGGVPICWPWFGPHERDPGLPSHGFARTAQWAVERSEASPDGSVLLTMAMIPTDLTRTQWPHAMTVQVIVSLGTELRIDLITKNSGSTAVVVGEALHTYFAVSDIRQAKIFGLAGCNYVDKVDGGRRKVQDGAVTIGGEVDRVYFNTTSECSIEDAGLNRRIRIKKSGSRSTVVWNPWSEKAAKMGDFGSDGYLGMVCIESGNALENVVTVEPGGEHILSVRYSVEAMT